jgi:hypothetical protein
LLVLDHVAVDLRQGKRFYDDLQEGIGGYFFDSIIADIESLRLYAGVHVKHFGYYRMLSYPSWIRKQLDRSIGV